MPDKVRLVRAQLHEMAWDATMSSAAGSGVATRGVNRYGEKVGAERAGPRPFDDASSDLGRLLVKILALPAGATMLVAGLGATVAPLRSLERVLRLSVVAQPGQEAVIGAQLRSAAVLAGPITRYMGDELFDYSLAGLAAFDGGWAPGFRYDHAQVTGAIDASAAAIELAVRSVEQHGFIALLGTKHAFRSAGNPSMRAWISRRAREVGTFFLPLAAGAGESRLQLTILEKGAGLPHISPLRVVLPSWRLAKGLQAWRSHLEQHGMGLNGYAMSRVSRSSAIVLAPAPLSPS